MFITVMQPVFRFLKAKSTWIGLLRYLLALGMLPYAISKILLTQFIVLPFDNWQKTLEETNGITLAWAFLGHAPWFQVMLGFFELIPSLLLLFRRTALGGAVLMLPLTLNVLLINYALELWSSTQSTSLFFFILNLLILLIEWQKIAAAVRVVMNTGLLFRKAGIEWIINIFLVAIISLLIAPQLLNYRGSSDMLTGDWLHNHPNMWKLESESFDDSLVPPREQVLYFQPMGLYRMTQSGKRSGAVSEYKLNVKEKMVSLKNYQNHSPANFSFTLTGDSILLLRSDKNWRQVYRRHVIGQ